ncbi:MAG: roadblock/LC7 domain-containing protein [Gammaproteobacteria bacterium]|nr:roadblock/LC7 domain-containing protein [Gammaproteobacteria bacterium]MCW8909588.1 roadblock/LC7 domain-containing protein [Gammaproteobacteria bacterium]MCW9003901.1 roadblock/LC7 domain-containing protein [Gammaproteobacteria bacterium]MCW9056250.1 roadblock/LC7 domain-containing protein [Gammaproteobacteria bacterium]
MSADSGFADKNDERGKALRPILRAFNGASNDIEASAVISGDGFSLAWVLHEDVDPDRFGAMCASLLALANRAAQEISRGELKQVLIEGDKGSMLLVYAGDDAVLAVAAQPTVNLGMVFIEARKAAQNIKTVLEKI